MNAPETIRAADPINPAHKVLLKSDDALCAEEIACAILGVDKPSKIDIKSVTKQLKQLADLGMIEMEPRAGGVPFYRLIAAPPSVVTHNPHTGTPRNPLDIESDPAGLLIVKDGEPLKAHQAEDRILTPEAEAEREDFEARYGMLGNCSCHISPPCGSCVHPGNPRNQEEDETAWMAAGDSEGGEADSPVTFLAPEDYEMPPADPALLASANRMLCDRLESIAEALRASTIPELEGVTGAEDLAPHVKTLCDALAAAEITSVARGQTINQLRLEIGDLRDQVEKNIQDHAKESAAACAALDDIVFEPFSTSLSGHIKEAVNEFKKVTAERADLRERLDGVTQQSIADTVALTEKNARLSADLEDMARERDLMKAENLALKTLEGSMPGFGAEHQEQRISSLTTDVINTRNALTNTINEADRLRSELATARVLIKAMQEHGNVKDVAVGYLVRVPKRAPVLRRKPESARAAALSAVRAGAARAEVLAVVPVGAARRGAEWKGA